MLKEKVINIEAGIRTIPDFPKPGIQFKDITPLLKDPVLHKEAVNQMMGPFKDSNIDYVLSIESRGFFFGIPMAHALNAGFIPVRKPGKLPADTISVEYDLEYGKDSLAMHSDALEPGSKVLIVDDVIATGGTMMAAISLAEHAKAEIKGISVLIELEFLNGKKSIQPNYPFHSVIIT
jgi:adenine phosphoribosyltransferase